MIPERFAIHLAGPSCSGKSSIFKELIEKLPDTYLVSYDKMKWQISHYHRDKHKPIIKELVVGLFDVVCQKKLPILLDAFIEDEKEYAEYNQIAEYHGYLFLSIELTAPIEVLLARFHERVANVTQQGIKISVTDEATFLTQTSKRPFIHEGTPVFDTSVANPESIVNSIIELLSSKAAQ